MKKSRPGSQLGPAVELCPGCGAAVVGGQEGCQALLEALTLRAYSHPSLGGVYPLAFDAYCMQHLDKYCHSAKSYAAHLTRLCCGIEYRGDPQVYAAIQKWLNGSVALEKPPLLTHLGELTILSLTASDPLEQRRQAQAWAQSVWTAYTPQHPLARAWIQEALGREKHR